MNFQSIELTKIVTLIVNGFSRSEVSGLDRLGAIKATVQVKGVPAREALQRILNCAGFMYREGAQSVAIVPLDAKGTPAAGCGDMQITHD
jgi:hypothetical protein